MKRVCRGSRDCERVRGEVWWRRGEEPVPPDEGGTGQDPPRTDWHLETREGDRKHYAILDYICLHHLSVSPVPTAMLAVLLCV